MLTIIFIIFILLFIQLKKHMEPEEIEVNASKLAKFYNQERETNSDDEFFAEENIHFKYFHLSVIDLPKYCRNTQRCGNPL